MLRIDGDRDQQHAASTQPVVPQLFSNLAEDGSLGGTGGLACRKDKVDEDRAASQQVGIETITATVLVLNRDVRYGRRQPGCRFRMEGGKPEE